MTQYQNRDRGMPVRQMTFAAVHLPAEICSYPRIAFRHLRIVPFDAAFAHRFKEYREAKTAVADASR